MSRYGGKPQSNEEKALAGDKVLRSVASEPRSKVPSTPDRYGLKSPNPRTPNTEIESPFKQLSLNPKPRDKMWLGLRFADDERKIIRKPHELERDIPEAPEPMDTEKRDRIIGSMLAMAVCDALGAHVEFRPREYLLEHPVTDFSSGGTWSLLKGQFTDDTSMALCLANSLIACQGFNLYDQLVRYKWWYRHGYMSSTGKCFDIGNATRDAIEEFERRQLKFVRQNNIPDDQIDDLHTLILSKDFDVRCSTDGVAGNGALMRLAPVPLFFFRDPPTAVEYSGQSGLITHGDRKVYDACRYYGALIVAALHDYSKDQLLDHQFYEKHVSWFGGKDLHPDIMQIAEGSYEKSGGYDDGIRGGGYIVKALEAALWSFWSTTTFQEGALAAVNLGDDTDTTAAIYGQLAGAFYGWKKLHAQWLDEVYAKQFLLKTSLWLAYEGEQCHMKMNDSGTLLSQKLTHAHLSDDQASTFHINPDKLPVHPKAEISAIQTWNRGQHVQCSRWIKWSPEEIFAWLKSIGIRDEKCLEILKEKQIHTCDLWNTATVSRLEEIGITNPRDRQLVLDKMVELKKIWAYDFRREMLEVNYHPPKERIPSGKHYPFLRSLDRKRIESDEEIHQLFVNWIKDLPATMKLSEIHLIYNEQRTQSFFDQLNKVERRMSRDELPPIHWPNSPHQQERIIAAQRLKTFKKQVKHRRSSWIVRGWRRIREENIDDILAGRSRTPNDKIFKSSALATFPADNNGDRSEYLLMSYLIVSEPVVYSLNGVGGRFRFICDAKELTPEHQQSFVPGPPLGPPAIRSSLDYFNQNGTNDEFVSVNEEKVLDYAVVLIKPKKKRSIDRRRP